MKARHSLSVLFVAFAIAGSCTNDFDKFGVAGDDDGDGTNGGSSGASGIGGATPGGTAGSGGTLVPGMGGTSGRGGTGTTGGTAGASGTSGEAGAAGSAGCGTDEKDCDGTCMPLTDPASGCGSPDTCEPCVLDHATPACMADECSIGRCDADWGDCNGLAADGCEQTLDTVAHCGDCDRACATTGVASAECSSGRCVSSCSAGSANCTIPTTGADDGCETSTASDAENCGGCDNDCTAQGLGTCSNGLCACSQSGQCGNGSGVACSDGLCSCDATVCRPGERCRQSGGSRLCSCNGGAACTTDQVCCQTPAGCTDVRTSPTSCGACGRTCTAGFICSAGECACDADEDCDAGMPDAGAGGEGGGPSTAPACVSGKCVCGATTCAEGERCLDGGGCG